MRMKGERDWRDLQRKTRYFFYLLVLPTQENRSAKKRWRTEENLAKMPTQTAREKRVV